MENMADQLHDPINKMIVATLHTHGPMRKGKLVAMVMQQRGFTANEMNYTVRSRLNELEKRGVLTVEISHKDKKQIVISLAHALADSVPDEEKHGDSCADELTPHHQPFKNAEVSFSQRVASEMPRTSGAVLDTIVENLATLNKGMAMLLQNKSFLQEQIAEIRQMLAVFFDHDKETGMHQHATVLRELSELRDTVVGVQDTVNNTCSSFLAQLKDLQENEESRAHDGMVQRLEESHDILRKLVMEQNATNSPEDFFPDHTSVK